MSARFAISRGHLIADLLRGSWRSTNKLKSNCTPAQLEDITSLLINSGSGALAWTQIKHSELRDTSCGAELQHIYRHYAVQAVLYRRAISEAVATLRAAKIEPILVKGWLAARNYCDEGLRPTGDIDVCVHPNQFAAACDVVNKWSGWQLDLHCGFEKFGSEKFDELADRAMHAALDDVEVRVPCPEDHLRILVSHMLREGAWRPVWLCDVAAAAESASEQFDWDRCFGRNKHSANWIICALRLAQELLDARIESIPVAHAARKLPAWIAQTIFNEWGTAEPSMRQRHRVPMSTHIDRRENVTRGLASRWPNSIEATVALRRSFNKFPRFPYQLATYLTRASSFVPRAASVVAHQRIESA